MSTPRPLSLKRQRSALSSRKASFTHKAEVLVDNGVFHLDQPFSFGVPDDLAVVPGSIVTIPFGSSTTQGLVVEVTSSNGALHKPILQVKGWASPNAIDLARQVAREAGTSSHDLLKYVYSSSATTSPSTIVETQQTIHVHSIFHRLRTNPDRGFASYIAKLSGRILVIAPTLSRANRIQAALGSLPTKTTINLTGAKVGAKRQLIDRALRCDELVLIGSRSALFATSQPFDHLVILDDWAAPHWEERRPYWNTRDVARTMGRSTNSQLHFLGTSPSLEIYHHIINQEIQSSSERSIRIFRKRRISHLQDTFHATVREGLKKGLVLISVAAPGYGQIHLCTRCRSKHTCECGGTFAIINSKSFQCTLCSGKETSYLCRTCGGSSYLLLKKGAERIAEEIGRAFPRIPIHLRTSETEDGALPAEGIVIATYGSEPYPDDGYAAVVLLDGERLINRPFLRAEEETFHRWWNLISLARIDAPVYLSLSRNHAIVQSLISDNPSLYLDRALRDRVEAALPPTTTIIQIDGDARGRSSLVHGLLEQFPDGLTVLGSQGSTRVTIKVRIDLRNKVVQSILALQKYRSLKRLELLSIEVDPYDL